MICQPVRHWISGEPSPPSCEVSLGWRENQQLQAQGDRKMERACSDHVCSSRQSPCMCLLLGHNAYPLGVQKRIMCCLFPERMKTTTHKVTHDSNPQGAPNFRSRSDPRFVAKNNDRGSLVGHGPPISLAPAHRAAFETTDLETWLHAKLIPRKTAALQRREESLLGPVAGL